MPTPAIHEADHLARLQATAETAMTAGTGLANCVTQFEILLTTALDRQAQEILIATLGEDGAAAYVEQMLALLDTLAETFNGAGKKLRESKDGVKYLRVSLSSHYRGLLRGTPETPEAEKSQRRSRKAAAEN